MKKSISVIQLYQTRHALYSLYPLDNNCSGRTTTVADSRNPEFAYL